MAQPQNESHPRLGLSPSLPISRLPLEVLCSIFQILVAVDPPDAGGHVKDKLLRLGWVWITQACRHWRHVAVGDPRLWSEIVFGLSAEWTQEFMLRAQGTPITFRRLLSKGKVDGHLRDFKHNHLRPWKSGLPVLKIMADELDAAFPG
ncbi:hypothetical protein DENSPDRAFT_674356 [Dentipellis sp. KUC8613]|nr:hypothetical protein DENSPDRAFT_674356 [Dentipellis sp. KUC8613]